MIKAFLFLTPFHLPNIGGAETFTDGLEKELLKWNNVDVLTYQPLSKKTKSYEESLNCNNRLRIYRMAWLLKQAAVWRGVSIVNALSVIPAMLLRSILLLTQTKYEKVYCLGLLSGFVGLILKKLLRQRYTVTLLALYEFDKKGWLFNKIVKAVLKNATRVFVEGYGGEKELRLFDLREGQVVTFYHWVDETRFFPDPGRRGNRVRVLFIGRSIPEKGKHIIEEAERLINDPEKFEFVYAENIEAEKLPELYRSCDICCVPSLYAEGFSRVVAESLHSGCYVIASNRGSLPEMLKGFSGYVIIEPTGKDFADLIYIVGKIGRAH